MEQNLAQKERELETREIDLVAREPHLINVASNMSANQPPQPNKQKDSHTTSSTQTQEQNNQLFQTLLQTFIDTLDEIKCATRESHESVSHCTAEQRVRVQACLTSHVRDVRDALASFVQGFVTSLQHAQAVDVKGNVAAFVQQWYSGASARVSSLQRAHAAHEHRARACAQRRAQAARTQRDTRRAQLATRASKAQACLAEMEEESARLEKLLTQQLTDIETERQQTENRLQDWMAEKRRLLEEELAKHVATEKQALEDRLEKKMTEIELQKKMLEERMEHFKEWQQIQAEADKEELEMAEGDLEEFENVTEECAKDIKKYGKEFEEGTNAINVDMEIFSKNVVEVVEHINNEMLQMLEQTRVQVEQEVSNVISTDEATCKEFEQEADNMLTNIVDSTKQITDAFVTKIESNSSSAIQQLSSLTTSTADLISLSLSHRASHSASCEQAREEVSRLQAHLCDTIAKHAELEGRYLSEEYKVYSPTGATPVRTSYRYPRRLAATSPHDRVLQRFRAMKRDREQDNDCIVIESDQEAPAASDSECSTSEDSAVFAAPSPPLQNTIPPANKPFVKSTSETDILYTMKKQQENAKENANRSITSKKRSKLPAPSSLKKPLVERNDN